jgi:hypothetical protein
MIEFARLLRNVFSPNPDRRLRAIKTIVDLLMPNYRLTWHQIDWWSNTEFNTYLDQFRERKTFNTHRRWMLWQLLRLIPDVPGDTAECGVYEGSSSWLICSAIEGTGRMHHLFDSFEGLSAPNIEDGTYWTAGALAIGEDIVRQNLARFADTLEFHKGWIPSRFADVADRFFAFVHIDVDLGQPTLDSIQFFYPRLSNGGIMVCDDYGCSSCPGATRAIDRFLADKPEKMMGLDAGGGFFIKGVSVASRSAPAPPSDNQW